MGVYALGLLTFHLGHKNIIEVFMEMGGQITCFVSVAIRPCLKGSRKSKCPRKELLSHN